MKSWTICYKDDIESGEEGKENEQKKKNFDYSRLDIALPLQEAGR